MQDHQKTTKGLDLWQQDDAAASWPEILALI
jgi:hypothetical protein